MLVYDGGVGCPRPYDLLALAEGGLNTTKAVELLDHIDQCPDCLASLAARGRSALPGASLVGLLSTSPMGDAAPEEATTFRPPEEFDEYRLLRSLGQGAMGQ